MFWIILLCNHCWFSRFPSKSSMFPQRIINETSMFQEISTLKTILIIHICIEIINVSSTNHQWNINVSRDKHIKNNIDHLYLHRNHQCFINVASMSHRCLFNEQARFLMTTLMNHQCYHCVLDWGSVVAWWQTFWQTWKIQESRMEVSDRRFIKYIISWKHVSATSKFLQEISETWKSLTKLSFRSLREWIVSFAWNSKHCFI